MKKLLGILVLGLLLSGCGGGYSVFNPFINSENSSGGIIWNHAWTGGSYSGVVTLANHSCTAKGFEKARVSEASRQGEFRTYSFSCYNEEKVVTKEQKQAEQTEPEETVISDEDDDYLKAKEQLQ